MTRIQTDTLPDRRIAPEGAIELILRREPWQTEQSHREHVAHMIGRTGFIEYADGPQQVIATIRSH